MAKVSKTLSLRINVIVCLPRKDIHKYTWFSSDGHTKNQIDHVFIDKKEC